MQNNRKKKTWKERRPLWSFALGTICGLIFNDLACMDALRIKLGEDVVNGICIVVVVLACVTLDAIMRAIERIEKKRHLAQKPSPKGEA